MPLRLSAGISKKMGLPNYGSRGATCHVEIELDSNLLQDDLTAFHRHVHRAYLACAEAVNRELTRELNRDQNVSAAAGAPGTSRNGCGKKQHNGKTPNGPNSDRVHSNRVDSDRRDSDRPNSHSPNSHGPDANAPSSKLSPTNQDSDTCTSGNGHELPRAIPVSTRQIDYVRVLVSQIRGLGFRRLETVCRSMFGKPLSELSGPEVGRLIDTLKQLRSGKRELASVLTGDLPK